MDNRGWHKEPVRHSLASKGIKTNTEKRTDIRTPVNNLTPYDIKRASLTAGLKRWGFSQSDNDRRFVEKYDVDLNEIDPDNLIWRGDVLNSGNLVWDDSIVVEPQKLSQFLLDPDEDLTWWEEDVYIFKPVPPYVSECSHTMFLDPETIKDMQYDGKLYYYMRDNGTHVIDIDIPLTKESFRDVVRNSNLHNEHKEWYYDIIEG